MAREPFNPDLLPDIDPGPPALRDREEPGPLTVTQAVERVRDVLSVGLPPDVRIVGEVSNFNDRGHWYFSLKDEQNVIGCVMWASDGRKSGFTPQHGQQVVATGHFDIYGPQGRLQFYARKLDPVGQGALELRFRQLCEELRGLGYFEESRKKPMPSFPEHIAIITSAGGAALQDVIRTARQRWAGIRLSLFDVGVQGAGAAEEIAGAVDYLSEHHGRLKIDAVILTRGGGSLEDLWAFNERVVADALFRSRAPIAVGVGHETDVTIAELVADLRCSTPTQAAARLVPDAAAERQRLGQLSQRLTHALRRSGEHARSRLESVARLPLFRRPTDRFTPLRQGLDHLRAALNAALQGRAAGLRTVLNDHRHALGKIEPVSRLRGARERLGGLAVGLDAAIHRQARSKREHLAAIERQLACVGPRSILQRGYTYTTSAQGQVLRETADARRAGLLVTHFTDGQVESRVAGSAEPPKSHKRNRADPGNGGLFG